MRHRKATLKLGRTKAHRKAMFRNMVTSLFKYGQIETTDAKAKPLRSFVERMITLAKRGDLHARRQALAFIKDKSLTHKLFDEMVEQFTDRQGGYVRIIKKGFRKGDGAPVSIVQLITKDSEYLKSKRQKKKETKKADEEQKDKKADE